MQQLQPVIFPLPDYSPLLQRGLIEESACASAPCTFARFANEELYLRLRAPVADRVCGVLGSLAPPDEQALRVLLLAHTLRREGARRVVALLPYLGYARQDRAEHAQSLGAAWAGDLLRAAGVDRVITIDVHSWRAAACFPMPVHSLSPAQLFAEVLAEGDRRELTVVAPDEGALERCEALTRAAGIHAPLAYLHKRRDTDGVTTSSTPEAPCCRPAPSCGGQGQGRSSCSRPTGSLPGSAGVSCPRWAFNASTPQTASLGPGSAAARSSRFSLRGG